MNHRVIALIAFGWIVSLLGVATLAQTFKPDAPLPKVTPEPVAGMISGADIGFSPVEPLSSQRGRKIVGKLMVRVKGV
jgi:hypothetical protein